MIKYLKKIFALFLIGILVGCSTTAPPTPENDILLPEIDLIEVKEHADESLQLAQEARLEVKVLSAKIQDLSNQILNIKEDLKTLSPAKFEEIDNKNLVLGEEINLINEEISRIQKQLKMRQVAKRKISPGFAPTKEMMAELAMSPDQLAYADALKLYNKKEYRKAISDFDRALELAPSGNKAGDCQFWAGESYYNLNDYANAIARFQKVFSYTASQKKDDAQVKIGRCYEKMGDPSQSMLEYKKFLTDFPNSNLRKKVKTLIKALES